MACRTGGRSRTGLDAAISLTDAVAWTLTGDGWDNLREFAQATDPNDGERLSRLCKSPSWW